MDKQEIKQFKGYLFKRDWYKYTTKQVEELYWWINHLVFRFYMVWQELKKFWEPFIDSIVKQINKYF